MTVDDKISHLESITKLILADFFNYSLRDYYTGGRRKGVTGAEAMLARANKTKQERVKIPQSRNPSPAEHSYSIKLLAFSLSPSIKMHGCSINQTIYLVVGLESWN